MIVQIEHHQVFTNLHEVQQVEGMDGCLVGQYDPSGSLGAPGALDDPTARDTTNRSGRTRTQTACTRSNAHSSHPAMALSTRSLHSLKSSTE